MRGLAAAAVYAICIGSVLSLPFAHIAKHLIGDSEPFTHLAAAPILSKELRDDEALFSTPGQFLLLAPERLLEPLGTAPKKTGGAHWILPPVLGSETRATDTLAAFACFLLERQGERIVWAVMRDNAWIGSEASGVERFKVDLWWNAPLQVRFAVDERLYEAKNTLIARGRVLDVRFNYDGREVVLFHAPDSAPLCP